MILLSLQLSPQLSGGQALSRLELRAAPQQAGPLYNRMQLWKVDGSTPLIKITLVLFQVMGMGAAGPGRGLNGLPLSFRRSLVTEGGADLLSGLLWCCCSSSWLTWWAGACGLCLGCTICHTCPGQVAPGGLQTSVPGFRGQGGYP